MLLADGGFSAQRRMRGQKAWRAKNSVRRAVGNRPIVRATCRTEASLRRDSQVTAAGRRAIASSGHHATERQDLIPKFLLYLVLPQEARYSSVKESVSSPLSELLPCNSYSCVMT